MISLHCCDFPILCFTFISSQLMARFTFKGSETQVATVLIPFATEANFFRYDENAKTAVKGQLQTNAAMFRALHVLSPNLSYQGKKIQKALHMVWKDCYPKWERKPSPEFEKDWVKSMKDRLVTALHHLKKAKASKWAKALLDPGHAEDEVESGDLFLDSAAESEGAAHGEDERADEAGFDSATEEEQKDEQKEEQKEVVEVEDAEPKKEKEKK